MFGSLTKKKNVVRDRTVYMEVFAENRVAYRVTAGRLDDCGRSYVTYGIEAEDKRSGDKESIADFSRNIEDAVGFAEILISSRTRPRSIYNKALSYLCISI